MPLRWGWGLFSHSNYCSVTSMLLPRSIKLLPCKMDKKRLWLSTKKFFTTAKGYSHLEHSLLWLGHQVVEKLRSWILCQGDSCRLTLICKDSFMSMEHSLMTSINMERRLDMWCKRIYSSQHSLLGRLLRLLLIWGWSDCQRNKKSNM